MSKKRRSILRGGLIAFVSIMFFLPVMLHAGDLDPSGPPAPTMKTLDQIPPAWSQKLPASERFVLVLDGAAVLDKETGLVWEKAPLTLRHTWAEAISYCIERNVGGRRGWHLPTIEQLASLMDPTQIGPSLPIGHPFESILSAMTSPPYWSSTTHPTYTNSAWNVFFVGIVGWGQKDNDSYAWCVRGGQSHDAY